MSGDGPSGVGRLTLVGCGLINGSVALALKAAGAVAEVVAHDRNAHAAAKAVALGLADRGVNDPAEAVAGADVVILGVPPGAMGEAAAAIAPGLNQRTVVTDVGSTKASVIAQVRPLLPHPNRFVPGHPVAGTEHSGPEAAFATLYRSRRVILTPEPGTDRDAVERVRAMWEACGASVDLMEPEHHDRVLAITSHLPHLIAYTIVGTVADLEDEAQAEVFKYAAGGFTDFTRIAGSDPTMWRDVFLNNRAAVLEMLQRFDEDLTALQRAIRKGEGEALFDLFARTRAIRRGVVQAGQAYVRQPEDPLAPKPGPMPRPYGVDD